MKYNLASLAKRTGRFSNRASVTLPPISARLGTERAYQTVLQKMVRGIAAEVRTSVLPAVKFEPKITTDVDENIFTRLKGVTAALVAESSALVNRILQLEAERHTETFMRTVQSVIGIDISAVITQEDLAEYMRTAAARNTSLITSLGADMVKRVEQAVLDNAIAGSSSAALRKKMTDEFGIADRRAKLIARDQTAKINSDLNRIRQEQAGIEAYDWMTSQDERVRPLHREIDGRRYEWGKPTGAEQGLPPGQPIQCRCVARGVVSFEAKATKPAPIETPVALDDEMKKFVVSEGRKTGTEHLWSYDATTGIPLGKNTSGARGFVGFTPEFVAAIADPKRSIVAHHNHPSSRSFSGQDILELSRGPGLKGLWAHGHNGSSYYAEWVGAKNVQRLTPPLDLIDGKIRGILQQMVFPQQTLDASEAGIIHAHIVMLVARKKNLIRYDYTLAKETAAAVEKHRALIERIVNDY